MADATKIKKLEPGESAGCTHRGCAASAKFWVLIRTEGLDEWYARCADHSAA